MKRVFCRSLPMLMLASILATACATSKKLSYVVPEGIKSQEMEFKWPDGELSISGVLLSPGQYEKLVILVPADGPNTRFSHPELVDSLLEAGIAVLTYDERGHGSSTGSYEGSSYFDLAADVTLIARNLRRALGPDVRIGAIGIGDGGWKAMIAAHYDRRIEFMVLIGTPGVSGDIWVEQQVQASPKSWRLKRERPEETLQYIREINRILKRRQNEAEQLEELAAYLNGLKLSKKKKSRFSDPLYRSMVNISTDQFSGKNMARTLVLLAEGDSMQDLNGQAEAWGQVAERTSRVDVRQEPIFSGPDQRSISPGAIRTLSIWILGLSMKR